MRRPPHGPNQPLFSRQLIEWSLLQGAVALALVAAIFIYSSWQGMPEAEVRALTFFALVTATVGLILVNRSFSASLLVAFQRPNKALAWILAAVTAMLGLTLLWPFAKNLFRFGPLHFNDLALALGAGLAVVVFLELLKPHWYDRLRS